MSRSLIVLPDDSARPILDAINHAQKSLRIKMFVFSDPAVLQAVAAAKKRRVSVRVMLNPARRSGESENKDSRKLLAMAGVDVLDSNPKFDLTHEKSMVVDDETAFIMSFNWEPRDLTETRDYAVVTTARHEVAEVAECFDADWDRKEFTPSEHSYLIWCVGNGRQRIGKFIDEAKHTLWLQNERYQDPANIERLVRARERGVKIHVMARPPHKLKRAKLLEGVGGLRILEDVGVKVHKLKGLKLHAKLILADNVRGVVGSINLAPGSFDSRRECAIEVRDEDVVDRLHKVTRADWENSHPLDLTDEGLLAELQDYDETAAEDLALGEDDGKHKKH